MTLHYSPKDAKASGDCEVIISQTAYGQVVGHLSRDTSREHGGLLLGYELEGGTSEAAVFIMHSLPALHTEGSPTRLDIKADSWAEWDKIMDEYARHGIKMLRVGWYHSHPNIDIYLSRWDLDVCQEFKRPTQVAMVVDPIGKRGGFFV
ncbi:MAG: Mov34/MPN/PAD-1 family protein, partial [Bryobacteraceae bacterium]